MLWVRLQSRVGLSSTNWDKDHPVEDAIFVKMQFSINNVEIMPRFLNFAPLKAGQVPSVGSMQYYKFYKPTREGATLHLFKRNYSFVSYFN